MGPKIIKSKFDSSHIKIKKMARKLKTSKQNIKRLKYRVTSLKKRLNILSNKKLLEEEAIKVVDKTFTGIPSALMKRLLTNI